MEYNALLILRSLSSILKVDVPTWVNFDDLVKLLKIYRRQLDSILIELNKAQYITEFPLPDESVKIILTRKGYDAAQGVAE